MDRFRSFLPSALLAAALAASACAHNPPPAPDPVATTTPPPTPTAPPAPKCASFDDGCKADTSTKLGVLASGYAFTPPEGWMYANESDAVVTQTSNAVLALTTYDASDASKLAANRDAALSLLLGKLGQIDKPAAGFWGKPADTLTAGPQKDLPVALYADANVKRADKTVTLAAFDAPLPDKKTAVLGASFVPNDATGDSDQRIVTAVTSLAKAPASSP